MAERWRRPLKVLDLEPGREIMLDSDGRLRRSVKIVYDEESLERIRQGYACARCLEVFEVPWPLRCPTCKAPVGGRQAAYFEREVGADEWLGPKTTLEEERESLPERAEKEARDGN